MSTLAERIDNALPQTQCTRCGYADCAAYAQAIAGGEADIHQCPPGGAEGIERLARITGRPARPLGTEFGIEGPRALAVIDEHWCIGCTLCLEACPTDAILGINKQMHTVIEPHCTGCELCIPVCPVDCISLINITGDATGWQAWSAPQATEAQSRYAFHRLRVQRDADERSARLAARVQAERASDDVAEPPAVADSKGSRIAAALARARRRSGP
jgi:electron transport complex protein RnfB